MIEILPPMFKYKYDTWRILLVKCDIDNSVRLRNCIRNVNSSGPKVCGGNHRPEDRTRIGRRRRTPQSHLCWVLGYPHRRHDAIAAPHGLRENGSQQACVSHFHLKWMARIGADVRRLWQGRRIAARAEAEGTKKLKKKWQQRKE
jgi:hypothetical protein